VNGERFVKNLDPQRNRLASHTHPVIARTERLAKGMKTLHSFCWRHRHEAHSEITRRLPSEEACFDNLLSICTRTLGTTLRLAQQPSLHRYDAQPGNPFEPNRMFTVGCTHTHTFGYKTKYASRFYTVRMNCRVLCICTVLRHNSSFGSLNKEVLRVYGLGFMMEYFRKEDCYVVQREMPYACRVRLYCRVIPYAVSIVGFRVLYRRLHG
jgi:hypothetical protein